MPTAPKSSVIRATLSAGRAAANNSERQTTVTKSGSDSSRVTIISRAKVGEDEGLLKQAYDITSRQEKDEFSPLYSQPLAGSDLSIIPPLFNPRELSKMPLQNNTLGPCIAAMVTNVSGFGFSFEYIGPEKQDESDPAQAEKKRLNSMSKQPNPDEMQSDFSRNIRKDIESVGYATVEVLRDGTGRVVAYYHVPAANMRMTTQEVEPVEIDVWIERDGEFRQETLSRRFRRYVQIIEGRSSEDKVFYREYGDPRVIDPKTGRVIEDGSLGVEDSATEIIMLGDYTPGQPYPLPRWLAQLPSILGSWESELTNLQFFRDNGIPAAVLLVSGGILSQQTIADLRSAFTAVRGRASVNRVAVIEAQPHPDFAAGTVEGSTPSPKMELKPLGGDRQNDALFGDYDKANQDKIRSSFRLPPIFLGRSDDYTRATAEASLDTAESQVFSPEREKFDAMMNFRILVDEDGKPPQFWRFRSNPARLSNSGVIVSAMENMEKSGAMTPNQAIALSNELFGRNRALIKDKWGDLPFSVVIELMKAGKVDPGKLFPDLQGLLAAPPALSLPPAPGTPPAPAPVNEPKQVPEPIPTKGAKKK